MPLICLWLLVYTSFIMMVLRFCAGPIVHRLSPLGTLAVCAALAALGLVALSAAQAAVMIILAATLYAVGKTFFWPTTLGVVAEQFPKGGALTLNAMGGVGMLGVGGVNVHGQSLTELHPDEAVLAAKWLGLEAVIPMHYRGSEGEDFIDQLEKLAPNIDGVLMKPGDRYMYPPD